MKWDRALRCASFLIVIGLMASLPLLALALYRATGFQSIPLYGEYRLSPATSICLGKDLPSPSR